MFSRLVTSTIIILNMKGEKSKEADSLNDMFRGLEWISI